MNRFLLLISQGAIVLFFAASAPYTFAENGLNHWTWLNPLPTGDDLLGVTSGPNQFVAVGSGAVILNSRDGSNWLVRREGGDQSQSLSSVTYGNGKFCAVGTTGSEALVLTSADGLTWKGTNFPDALYFSGVAFGNGRFVAVGGKIALSTDGQNWSSIVAPLPGFHLSAVTFGADQFVAVGSKPSDQAGLPEVPIIATSPEGASWTIRDSGTTNSLNAITYAEDQLHFVAVGKTIVVSGDAVRWSETKSPTTNWLTGVAFDGRQFNAVSDRGDIIASDEGFVWTQRETLGRAFYAITYGSNTSVAVGGSDGPSIMSSTDGIDWVEHRAGTRQQLNAIAFGTNETVVVGTGGTVLRSLDLTNWSEIRLPNARALTAVTFGDGKYVAVGSGALYSSSDGLNWIQRTQPQFGKYPDCLAYGNGRYVATGPSAGIEGPGVTLVSTNAVDWIETEAQGGQIIAYGNGMFLRVGDQIGVSADAVTWDTRERFANFSPTSLTFGKKLFVALNVFSSRGDCCGSEIYTTRDGISWTKRYADPDIDLSAVAYGGGLFVAVGQYFGDENVLLSSTDGETWTRQPALSFRYHSTIAYCRGRFLVAGPSGFLIASDPVFSLTRAGSNSDGSQFLLEGSSELTYTLETSEDLLNWHFFQRGTGADLNQLIRAPASEGANVFYRASIP